MKNRYFLFFFFLLLVCLVALYLQVRNNPKTIQHNDGLTTQTPGLTVGTDVCQEFPSSWITEILKKPIVKTERNDSSVTHTCQYYVTDSAFIALRLNTLNVQKQKEGQTALGRTLTTNPTISIPHVVVLQDNGLINEILLILGPDLFMAVDRTSIKAASETELVAFAAKVGQRLQSNVTTGTNLPTQSVAKTVPLPQETDTINSFFSLINERRPSDAVSMMSAVALPDDSTRQAWAVQFNAIESIKMINIEPSMQDSWTDTNHSYKVTLDIKMKPDAINAQPIPNYGWDNGRNTRWVSLLKVNNRWMIDGLATGP